MGARGGGLAIAIRGKRGQVLCLLSKLVEVRPHIRREGVTSSADAVSLDREIVEPDRVVERVPIGVAEERHQLFCAHEVGIL